MWAACESCEGFLGALTRLLLSEGIRGRGPPEPCSWAAEVAVFAVPRAGQAEGRAHGGCGSLQGAQGSAELERPGTGRLVVSANVSVLIWKGIMCNQTTVICLRAENPRSPALVVRSAAGGLSAGRASLRLAWDSWWEEWVQASSLI